MPNKELRLKKPRTRRPGKKKKKKTHRKKQKRQKDSTLAIKSNAKPPAGAEKKQKDLNQITYFSCYKKSHYSKNYIEPKAKN